MPTTTNDLITTTQKLHTQKLTPTLYKSYISTLITTIKRTQRTQQTNPLDNPQIISLLQKFFAHPVITLSPRQIHSFLQYQRTTQILTIYTTTPKIFNIQQTDTIFSSLQNPIIQTFIQTTNIKFFTLTPKTIETIFLHQLTPLITALIDQKTQFTQPCLYNTIINNNLTLLNTLLLLGSTSLDTHCLELACKNVNIEMIKFIINNNIKPNTQCFNNICYSTTRTNRITAINILIQDGAYHITYPDIIMATKSHIHLDPQIASISQTTFEFESESFPTICLTNKFFPDYICLSPITPEFIITISQWAKYAPVIKNIITNTPHPLNLTIECLHAVCRYMIPSIAELVSQHMTPIHQLDIQCLQIACYNFNAKLAKHIIKKYKLLITPSFFPTLEHHFPIYKFINFLRICSIKPSSNYLDFACTNNMYQLASYLISTHHLKPSIESTHIICANGYHRIIKYMLSHNITDFDTECLRLTCSNSHCYARTENQIEIINLIVNECLHVPSMQCLKEAIIRTDQQIVEYLVKEHILPDIECLQIALRKCNMFIIQLLIYEGKAQPDIECLQIACEECDIDIVKFLVENIQIKPDAKCLEKALNKRNTFVVNFVSKYLDNIDL